MARFAIALGALSIGALVILSGARVADAIASSNPVSGDPAAIEQGKALYGKFCAQCHGATGDGVSPRWGKMGADLRKFWRGYSEFVIIVAAGRPKKRMPPWGHVLDADQINEIGAYIETLALPGSKWED